MNPRQLIELEFAMGCDRRIDLIFKRWMTTSLAAWLVLSINGDLHADLPYITHGPTLGRLTHQSVGVWARTSRDNTPWLVHYGTQKNKLDLVSKSVKAALTHDNATWVELTELEPNTRYFYRLAIVGQKGDLFKSGSFRTLPHGRAYKDEKLNPRGLFNFSFEYACGNNQNPSHSNGPEFPAMRTMLRELKDEIHFAILNGDWLYETERRYKPSQWLAQVDRRAEQLPHVVRVAPAITGVWQNYKKFYEQSDSLRRWHRNMPTFFTYDDHEILNDIWGAGSPGLRDRRAVFRDVGVRAWYDYLGWANPSSFTQPVHFGIANAKAGSSVLVDTRAQFDKLDLKQANNLHIHWGSRTDGVNENELDGVGGIKNAGVYEIVEVVSATQIKVRPALKESSKVPYSIGRRSYYRFRISNCDFFMLDTRGQREMHDTRQPDKPGLSILGKQQREWLMEGMRTSDADFLFVVSSVNLMVPHIGGGKVRATNKDDAWTVFFDEREKLINFWDKIDKPVLVLSGDLHNSFAIKITDNVWEMASGPHNSNNHRASDEGDRPANGLFKYGPREVDIRWSTHFLPDVPRDQLRHPNYCVVQLNNVFNNPKKLGDERWVAFPRPQVLFRFYDGKTGKLRYAESIIARPRVKR